MKLGCRECHKPLGLGVISARVWIPRRLWWEIRRFCSTSCKTVHLAKLREDNVRRRFVVSLFRLL